MKTLVQLLLSAVIISLSYFVPREQFYLFITLFFIGFGAMFYLNKTEVKPRTLFYYGVLLRLLTLFSVPLMSDDYFRFLWDGAMILNGINPLELTPDLYQNSKDLSPYLKSLYDGMNSKGYYTVYPPLNQVIFYLANLISNGNVLGGLLVIRLFLLLAEIFTYLGLKRLLSKLNIDYSWLVFYWLNPFVIMELTGNLHMEAIMIAGFLWVLIFLIENKFLWAAVALFFSINGKLHTLMFIPIILNYVGIKQFIRFISLFGMLVLLSVSPFLSLELLENLGSSLNLYFQSFEFNASIFYLLREIGFWVKGYDVVQTVGPILSIISLTLILFISLKSKVFSLHVFLKKTFYVFLIFLLFSSTIHPWYISLFLVLGILTQRMIGVIWTVIIMLTYFTYYTEVYKENLWLVLIEYLIVLTYGVVEYVKNSNPNLKDRKFFTI